MGIAILKNCSFFIKIHLTGNKTFWRNVKPLFSEKVNLQTKILLVEKGNDLSDPEISSEVEKVISEEMKLLKLLTNFL